MRQGKGAYLYDVGGNSYIDYVLSWGPLILGHAQPDVVAASKSQIENGAGFGTPTESELTLAQMITKALPSIQMLRFVNSGTEATMAAVELAKAYTQRERILNRTAATMGGMDRYWLVVLIVQPSLVLIRYSCALQRSRIRRGIGPALRRRGRGIIVEPIAANLGVVLPARSFLEGLRRLCDAAGSLLIFDEVMTGFRVAHGGAQTRFGVSPDHLPWQDHWRRSPDRCLWGKSQNYAISRSDRSDVSRRYLLWESSLYCGRHRHTSPARFSRYIRTTRT